jgi:GH15 family glucan-1,4-alpha-glucosidase
VNYIFLSNGLTSALENNYSIEWFPVPRFDSQSVFNKILDNEKGGCFAVYPTSFSSVKSEYIDYSLVSTTKFFNNGELIAKIIDFLPLSVPAIIRIYESKVPLNIEIGPLFNYGLITPSTNLRYNGIVYKNPLSKEGLELMIEGKFEVLTPFKLRISSGNGFLYLLYSRDLKYGLFSSKTLEYPEPYDALYKILNYYRFKINMSKKIKYFNEAYLRSLSVILGLIYRPSGGIISSPTTSIPEIIGRDRNWDYRYVWVRDASYAIEALTKANLLSEARKALDFLIGIADPSTKTFDHPYYLIDGTPPLAEEEIEWLEGFKNSKPVRIGNAAYLQMQSDIEGAFLNSFYEYVKTTNDKKYLEENFWIVEAIAEWTKNAWYKESTDIWEERNITRHYVHTKVMCWVSLDRASKIAKILGLKDLADEWDSMAEIIKNDILKNGVKDGHFIRYYGGNEVDASLLTLPIYDFINVENPIFLKTLEVIERELKIKEGLYLRYKRDFLGDVVNPFTLVTTWMARIYIRLGEYEKAKNLIKRLIECSNSYMLLGEHLDAESCEARGNFPHIFPHTGLVLAIVELNESMS